MTIAEDLVSLSHRLADPAADLVILGEGNTSADLGDGAFLVKASGTSLGQTGPDDFVRMDAAMVLAAIDDPALDPFDTDSLDHRMRMATDDPAGPRPSIEVLLHALAIDICDARFVAHTHPTAVNALLCSDRADELVAGQLFPDQVVVCGRHPLLVPYVEPGLPLARDLAGRLHRHLDRFGEPPRLIYLANHGIVALGPTAAEILRITAMTVKAARVLQSVLALGRPVFLPDESADRLDTRPDELHRRAVLAHND
jgi:rhamnose utilization protein RhaD (predicted bifunctional aldolase and dehydrogenase)